MPANAATTLLLIGLLAGPLTTAPATRAQVTFTQSSGSGGRIISPSVVAMWRTSGGRGPTTLEYLVLWRGAPGWSMQPGSSSGGGGGMGGSGRGDVRGQGGRKTEVRRQRSPKLPPHASRRCL